MPLAKLTLVLIMTALGAAQTSLAADAVRPDWMPTAVANSEKALVAEYGDAQHARIRRGVAQVADFWRVEDGDQTVFEAFVSTNFAGDAVTLDAMFERFEYLLEQYDGNINQIVLAMRRQTDLELGPILPFDRVTAGYDPGAHFDQDWFANKLAFTVLLNFPLTTLEQRLTEGDDWT
ncbi:MAG: hypothetical protein WBO47_13855, partial [Gammaproteobacteria bacterium]